MAAERGQAQIEALAVAGLLAILAAAALWGLATINSALVIDGATHAAGLAQASGRDPVAAARRALPRKIRRQAEVRSAGGATVIRLRLEAGEGEEGRGPSISSRSWARPPR